MTSSLFTALVLVQFLVSFLLPCGM